MAQNDSKRKPCPSLWHCIQMHQWQRQSMAKHPLYTPCPVPQKLAQRLQNWGQHRCTSHFSSAVARPRLTWALQGGSSQMAWVIKHKKHGQRMTKKHLNVYNIENGWLASSQAGLYKEFHLKTPTIYDRIVNLLPAENPGFESLIYFGPTQVCEYFKSHVTYLYIYMYT